MKYKTPKQVMVKLINGGKIDSMRVLSYRNKSTKPAYSKIIEDGILMYEDYLVDQELRNLIDPDYELTALEYEEVASKYNTQD